MDTSFAILLDNPKSPHHVGQAVRLAACYGGESVTVTGTRCRDEVANLKRIPREERMKGYQHIDLQWHSGLRPLDRWAARDEDWTPICVEVDPSAESLPYFQHPANAIYIFGAEDGSVRQGLRHAAHRFVTIPTAHCLNLGHAMATVLYDRAAKHARQGALL